MIMGYRYDYLLIPGAGDGNAPLHQATLLGHLKSALSHAEVHSDKVREVCASSFSSLFANRWSTSCAMLLPKLCRNGVTSILT